MGQFSKVVVLLAPVKALMEIINIQLQQIGLNVVVLLTVVIILLVYLK